MNIQDFIIGLLSGSLLTIIFVVLGIFSAIKPHDTKDISHSEDISHDDD